jgi:hypothetical protein
VTYQVAEYRIVKAAEEIARKVKSENKRNNINKRQKELIENIRKKEVFKKEKINNQKNLDKQRQLKQTCKFWQDQYGKTRNAKDKQHRDNACKSVI